MQCPEIRKLLPGLALGDLDAEPAREAAAHLEGCAGCRAERSALDSALAALPSEPASTERRQAAVSAMAKAHAERAEQLLSSPRRPWPGLAVAAAALLCASLTLFILRQPGVAYTAAEVSGRVDLLRGSTGRWSALAPRDVVSTGDRVVTHGGASARFALASGHVTLEAETSVSILGGGRLSLDRGRLTAELEGGAREEVVVTDTANNAAVLKRGRIEAGTREVRGLVAAARQESGGASSLPEPRVDAAHRLSIRVLAGEADLTGSHDQRLRAEAGQEGTFDFGGRPATAPAGDRR